MPDVRRPASRLAVALLLLLGADGEAAAAMDPTAFVAEIHRLTQSISSASPEAASRIAVPAVWTVESGGQTFEVPAVWLVRALGEAARRPESWTTRRSEILERLAALQREAMTLRTERRPIDTSAARAELQSVLAGREFRRMASDNALSELRAMLARWFDRLWRRFGGDRLDVRSIARFSAWLISAAALFVLLLWVRRWLRPSMLSIGGTAGLHAAPTAADEWARRAVAATTPREAARCAYRAAVCRLHEQGIWRVDDARTPREYLRLLQRADARYHAAAEVLKRFEEVWFAGRQPTEDDRRRLLGRLRELGCLPAN